MKMRFGAIAAPLFLELSIGMAVGMLGTSFAAHISDAAGGAFALTNQLFGLLFMVFRLVGAGIGVVVSQNLGAQHRHEADRVARAALAAGTWMGGSMAVVALVLATPLLQALSLALLLDAWNACMASVMRAHLRTRETLGVMLVMHAVHVGLAWPLMHGVSFVPGLENWPGFGLPGFALALVISRLVGLWLHWILWQSRLKLVPDVADFWRFRKTQIKHILHIGLPGAAENLSWELAFLVSVAAVGLMGTQALATQAYVLQFNMWILISGAAIGIAVEMVVGHLVGARKLREAHVLVKRAQTIGFAVTLVVAVLMAWQGASLLRWFTDDPAILAEGQRLLWWSILLETGRTFNLIVISALRATGDSKYPFYAGAGSMAVVLAGGSWLLGVHWGWGLTGIWIAYAADEWIRGLLMWHRWVSRGWIPHARATHARMRHQTPSPGIPQAST